MNQSGQVATYGMDGVSNDRAVGPAPTESATRGRSIGPIPVTTGFVPKHPVFHRTYNVLLGLVLLLVALPLILAISLALLLTQGWQVFYRGARIGQGGSLYHILKFRTLNGDKAREITKNSVLPSDSGIETPLGGFLRDTRLDELPQLLCVVLGQMNICGPRPVRPEIAEAQRALIPNYDLRFEVRPGLLGPTQAYMHHGTSKAIRARYNAILCQAPVSYPGELRMVALVGFCVLERTVRKLWHKVTDRVSGSGPDGRAAATAADARLSVRLPGGAELPVARVDRTTLTLGERALAQEVCAPLDAQLSMTLPNGQVRDAAIRLVPGPHGVFGYAPRTDYAHHVISRYLWQAVVVPHKSQLPGAGFRRPSIRLGGLGRRAEGVPAFVGTEAKVR